MKNRSQAHKQLIDLPSPWQDPLRKSVFNIAKAFAGIQKSNKMWNHYIQDHPIDENDPKAVIDGLFGFCHNCYHIKDEGLANIPTSGPTIMVSNHPFGFIDGILLIRAALEVRSDVKVLANGFLHNIGALSPLFINVNPMGNTPNTQNMQGLRKVLKWLRAGGLLIVMPSGEVAARKWTNWKIREPKWSPTLGGIARMSEAQVIPCFIDGHNDPLFQMAGFIHPRLRTLMIPRANIKHKNKVFQASIGSPISPKKLERFTSDSDMTQWLRFRSYLLKTNLDSYGIADMADIAENALDIIPPAPKIELAKEFESMPSSRMLAQSNGLCAFYCKASEAPYMMQEIGRLREETFRLVGEGTGQASDLDSFDKHYFHLILWNKEENEICGAYRFGKTDELTKNKGIKALYTASLFKMDKGFLEQMNPALEVGRSFIIPKYQKSPLALLTLWRAIAQWCFLHPHYNKLFGVVSVSADYHPLSREIISLFLKQHSWFQELAPLVKARKPVTEKKIKKIDGKVPKSLLSDPEDISAFVAQIESGRDIPVLLKQYLKLGGRLLGFNIDPDFGDCMDGLIVVDLKETELKVLARFMGSNQAKAYFRWHELADDAKATTKTIDLL
ncbi:MAG: lysophospholipid acyltransferase family protein [Alphaproteobacteria bacterium]